jgi:hypothetical protein
MYYVYIYILLYFLQCIPVNCRHFFNSISRSRSCPLPLSLSTHTHTHTHTHAHIYIYIHIYRQNTGKNFLCTAWSLMGEVRCIQIVLNPGTRWRWVPSFKRQLPHFLENSLLYALNRKLYGSQMRTISFRKDNRFLHLPGIKLRFFGLPILSPVSI